MNDFEIRIDKLRNRNRILTLFSYELLNGFDFFPF